MISLLLTLALLLAAPSVKPPAKPEPAPAEPPAAAPPADDNVAEYVEYRAIPELGLISVSDGIVRGRKPVSYLRSHIKDLAVRGIFPCTDEKRRRSYHRKEELAGHTFETLVVIQPPADADGDWTRRLTVRVDGHKKVDCSIGDSADGDVFVYGVTIFPDDGTIEVAAVDADGEEIFPPDEMARIDAPGVITDDTLQPDNGDDDEDKSKPLEKA
jgi:hypothetical protein